MFNDRCRAAFLGLALGDAYGRSLEFVRGAQVRSLVVSIPSAAFMWTDDTHMALYLAAALRRLGRRGVAQLSEDALGLAVGEAFIEWADDPLTPSTAPGTTCLRGTAAFRRVRDWRRSGLAQSDGCGAVMRVAPLPMVFSGRDLVAAARIQAVVTHAHPNAPAAAVAACVLLRDLLDGAALSSEVVLATASRIRALPEGTETVALALEAAVAQAARPKLEWLDEDDIPDGDGGWRSPSALGLAIVAALRWGHDAALAIEKAARIDGDSDSVACLAGMFIGAAHGTAVLPAKWLEALPQRTRIESAVDAMLSLSDAEVDQVPAPAPAGARTSETDPIRVCAIPVDLGERGGGLGVTFAPGKRATSSFGGLWHRDLGADLDRLAGHFGVDVLVSLVEDDELYELGIPNLVSAAERRGIAVLRLPIPDGGTAEPRSAQQVVQAAASLALSGRHVVFHCRGGLGRAGTLAACALVHLGATSHGAISEVRRARPNAIENSSQEGFVRAYGPARARPPTRS